MRHYIAAQRAAFDLARVATQAIRLERYKRIPEQKLRDRQEQELERYGLHLDNARLVPTEFSLLTVRDFEASSFDDLSDCNQRLGRLALGIIPVRTRAIRGAKMVA